MEVDKLRYLESFISRQYEGVWNGEYELYQKAGEVVGVATTSIYESLDELFYGTVYFMPFMDDSSTAVVAADHLAGLRITINKAGDTAIFNESMSGYDAKQIGREPIKDVLTNKIEILMENAAFKMSYLLIGAKLRYA